MIATQDLQIVSATYHALLHGYAYHFITGEMEMGVPHVLIKRVKHTPGKKDPSWNHGVLSEMIEAGINRFKPTCAVVSPKKFGTLEEAVIFVNSYQEVE